MDSQEGFSSRGIVALFGGVALCMWGLGVCLGIGIGYDEMISSFVPVTFRIVWQLVKGACLIAMGVCVVKEEIECVDCRAQAAYLQQKLHEIRRLRVHDWESFSGPTVENDVSSDE